MIAKNNNPPVRTGVWIAGAKGDIASTLMVGSLAMAKGMTSSTGLVSALPPIDHLSLLRSDQLVFGGLDVSDRPLAESAESLYVNSRTISRELLDAVLPDLQVIEQDIVTAPELIQSGDQAPTLLERVERVQAALRSFKDKHQLERMVVVNLSSAEPVPQPTPEHASMGGLRKLIAADQRAQISPGLLYAYAALDAGYGFVNFTPNQCTQFKGIHELAAARGLPFCGDDGKTGETLVKSALAPMFACRNLRVLSWEGFNVLGNNDGKVLDEPENKVAKVLNKGKVLNGILGYEPHGLVQINYVPSLGDWKTAWDLVHFEGFLGTKMSMQFTWQGCDSILAAPLVLDLVRLTDFAMRQEESGPMRHLACFFKNPLGVNEMALWPQFQMLVDYCNSHLDTAG